MIFLLSMLSHRIGFKRIQVAAGSYPMNVKLLLVSLIVMKIHISQEADYPTKYFLFYIVFGFYLWFNYFHYVTYFKILKCKEQTDYCIFSNNCLSDAIELYNRFDIIVCQNPSKGNKTKKSHMLCCDRSFQKCYCI